MTTKLEDNKKAELFVKIYKYIEKVGQAIGAINRSILIYDISNSLLKSKNMLVITCRINHTKLSFLFLIFLKQKQRWLDLKILIGIFALIIYFKELFEAYLKMVSGRRNFRDTYFQSSVSGDRRTNFGAEAAGSSRGKSDEEDSMESGSARTRRPSLSAEVKKGRGEKVDPCYR